MERLLSPSERAVWLLDQAVALNGVLVAHIEGPLDEARVRAGLSRLQRRHPLLRVAVEGLQDTAFVDGGGADVPLRVVRRDDDRAWHAIAEEELNARFDPSARPLMRAVLVAGGARSELVTCYHHLICDALSAVVQMGELLAEAEDDLPSLPLRPAMQELLPASARGASRVLGMNNFLWRQAATSTFTRPRKLPLDERPAPSLRRTRIVDHQLSREQTDALVARCRAESTTLQGALVASLLLAAGEAIRAEGAVTLGCFSAIDLRAQLAPPVAAGEVGLYVSQATTFHRTEKSRALWDLAREVKKLTQRIASGEPFLTFPLLGLFVPRGDDQARVVERFARRVDQASPAAVGVTNIGRLPLPARHGALTLTRLHFAIGIGPVVPAAITACTLDGALAWNFLYVEPLLSPERAAAIDARITARLSDDR